MCKPDLEYQLQC